MGLVSTSVAVRGGKPTLRRCYSPGTRMPISLAENDRRTPGMVDLEIDDGLAVITIDRPHARNAISLETMGQLDDALTRAEGARALVVKGAGDKAFVSG